MRADDGASPARATNALSDTTVSRAPLSCRADTLRCELRWRPGGGEFDAVGRGATCNMQHAWCQLSSNNTGSRPAAAHAPTNGKRRESGADTSDLERTSAAGADVYGCRSGWAKAESVPVPLLAWEQQTCRHTNTHTHTATHSQHDVQHKQAASHDELGNVVSNRGASARSLGRHAYRQREVAEQRAETGFAHGVQQQHVDDEPPRVVPWPDSANSEAQQSHHLPAKSSHTVPQPYSTTTTDCNAWQRNCTELHTRGQWRRTSSSDSAIAQRENTTLRRSMVSKRFSWSRRVAWARLALRTLTARKLHSMQPANQHMAKMMNAVTAIHVMINGCTPMNMRK